MELTQVAQKFLHAKHGARGRDTERHVHRDWFLELFVSALLLGVVGMWSLYLYTALERGDFFSAEVVMDSGSVTLNREKLDSTLSFIAQKQIQHNALKESATPIADPSI